MSTRSSTGLAMPRAHRLALLACLAAGFTTLLDQAIVNLAVPSLTQALRASAGQVQWLLASYSLTFGLALVPAGRLGDIHGRRPLFLIGTGLFATGSLLSGLAPVPQLVIVARLLQGVGGGVINAQVYGTIQDLFDARGRIRAISAYGVAGGLSGLTGPLLGALLVTVLPLNLGWRLVVAVSAPLAAATFVFGATWLPRRTRPDPRSDRSVAATARVPIDVLGLSLLALATIAVLLPMIRGLLSGPIIVELLIVAAVSAAAFAWWEGHAGRRNSGRVILPPQLLRAPGFMAGTLVATFFFGAQLAQSAVVILYLLATLKVAPLLVALVAVPSSASMALAAALSPRVMQRYGTKVIATGLVAETLLLTVVALTLPHLARGAAIGFLLVMNALSGAAGGFVDSPNRAYTLRHTPDAARGVAAGFLQLAQRLSSTICIAAATGIALGASTHPSRAGVRVAVLFSTGLVAVSAIASLRRAHREAPTTEPDLVVAASPQP